MRKTTRSLWIVIPVIAIAGMTSGVWRNRTTLTHSTTLAHSAATEDLCIRRATC
jgi:hypothetical protein